MTEFFQGMGTLCPRWLPGHLLSVEESRLARRPPLKAARSGLYASERIHHWDWFEFEANAKTFKPWTGRFFGLFWAVWGQAASLRVRPGAFLFGLARLYTQAQRLDQPHHPQQEGVRPNPRKFRRLGLRTPNQNRVGSNRKAPKRR